MGTVVGSWRLKLVLLLVVFSTCVYTASAVFGNITGSGTVNEDGYITYNDTSPNDLYINETELSKEKGQGIVDVLGGLGDFLTFAVIDNVWARLLFNGIMALVWITIAYLVFTFVKEFIPFV